MSRVSPLDEFPDSVDQLVELLGTGATREQIAKVFGVNKRTITEWRKRDDVQQKLSKFIRDRANRVLSLTDDKVLKQLESNKQLSVDQLLKIRQTYAGEAFDVNAGSDAAQALSELMKAADKDPALARALAGVLPDAADGD